jgi:hypothetical protein
MKKTLLLLVVCLTGLFSSAQTPGNALHFDGTNDYVSCTLPALFTNLAANDFTVEAWISHEISNGGRIFFAQQDASNFASLLLNNGNTLFYVKISNVTYSSFVPLPPAGEWIHIACTWDASALLPQIYYNGVLQTAASSGASSSGTNNIMTIGSRTDGAQPYTGYMDEFRLWNTARTACEILGMMHSEPNGTEVNLVAYYDFNRGTAGGSNPTFTTLPDQVGVSSGTLNNFALNGPTSNWVASGAGITAVGVQPSYTVTLANEICQGGSYVLGSQTLTASGTYNETFTSSNGCDSLVTLQLTVHPIVTTTQTVNACNAYQWMQNNTTYTTSGIYTDTVTGTFGCDSILALDLTINQPTASSETVTACGSYEWAHNGVTYTASGLYTDTIPNVSGCDSILSLNLTINQPTFGNVETMQACGSYLWLVDGQTYTTSGTYTAVLTNAAGCDSILTLDLTIHTGTQTVQNEASCGPYFWEAGGTTVSISGTYTANLLGVNGCDSIVTLDIVVQPVPTAQLAYDGNVTLSNATPATMVIDWIDCSTGLPIPGMAGMTDFTPTQNGTYAVLVADDVTFCSDMSDCFTVDFLGLDEQAATTLSISPNPATDAVTVHFSGAQGTLAIWDAQGKLIREQAIVDGGQVGLSELQKGVYFFCVQTEKGKSTERVIVE